MRSLASGRGLHNVPAELTSFVGRRRELAEIKQRLRTSRLVTLTGAGGTGKTRLALQVATEAAGRFADGVAFIDLAPVNEPALLATAIAAALGLAPPTTGAAEDHVTRALRGKHLLLVVDNLEHLLEGAPVLGRMLTAAPRLQILATSRIALRLYGEHTLRVPPLRLPGHHGGAQAGDSEAVQLFVARAQAVSQNADPGPDDLAAIGAICTALDGLPLAIELAAARARLYPPPAMLSLLHSRLTLLTSGPRDLPHRQQTLRATLDWSHALLPATEQALFAQLGVFAGPFDATAAAVSAAHNPATMLDQLAGLADQGLLEVTPGQPPSFRMLQTVREYALARLAETGEQDAARRRHLAHYLSVAVAARENMEGPDDAEWLDRLELAHPNFRAALEFACTQAGRDGSCLGAGLRLAASLWYLWERRGPLAEGLLHLDRLLALDDAQHASAPQDRASARLSAGRLACLMGDYSRAAELALWCVRHCAPLGDHDCLAKAHLLLGEAAVAVGDDAAEPHYQRALGEASLEGSLRYQAEAHKMLGEIARHRGDFRRAVTLLEQALQLCQTAGHPSGVTAVLGSLGEVARDAGRPSQARRFYHAALQRHARTGNKRKIAYDLEGFAAAAALEHTPRQALVYLGAAQALREETGGPLPPVEQAILTQIFAPAFAALPAEQHQDALSEGGNQPLSAIVTRALDELPSQDRDDLPGTSLQVQVPESAKPARAPDA